MLLDMDAYIESTQSGESKVPNGIVVGDCLESLRCLPDASVALIHTSPPYNIGDYVLDEPTLT